MQTWEQNMMYKQLQELQRQQQLRESGEARLHSSLNQLPLIINGTPVHDAPNVLMNLMPDGLSPDRHAFPQDRNQTMHSMSMFPQEHFLQMNSSLPELNERQNLIGNREIMHQNITQLRPSQGLVPLDPLEQKILYNMDDNSWDTGFGRSLDLGDGGFGSTVEQSDFSSALQSGSWSALMQSAVAEASGDPEVQEEWSGLSFQNTELSTNNQPANFLNEERRQTGWASNNMRSASSNSKSFPMFSDSSTKSSFPGFQQSDFQSSVHQGEGLRQYDSNESFQKPPKKAGEWLDCNRRHSNQISQQSDEQQRRTTSHNDNDQQFSKQKGIVNGAMHRERDHWTGRLGQQSSHTVNPMREDSQAHHIMRSAQTFGSSSEEASTSFQNFNGGYNSKGRDEQFRTIDNISKNAMNLDKERLPDSRGSLKSLDDSVYGGDHGSSTSTTFGQTVVSDRQNIALQTSQQHMLDLLHKVDQSREDSPLARFGGEDHNSLSEMPNASIRVDQFDQSSTSRDFGLKLSPPSQRFPNSHSFPPRHVNAESGLKNQGRLDSMSSIQSLRPNEFSQGAHWNDKSTNLERTNVSSDMNMHVSSDATLTSSSRVAGESSQATLTGTSSKFAHFNSVPSRDSSRQTPTNPGNPFPVLETTLLSRPSNMSNMSQKGGMLATHQNTWKNVPTSRFASKNDIQDTSWSLQSINEEDSHKGRMVSPDLQGSEYGEEQSGKQRSRHEISSEIQDSLQSGSLSDGQDLFPGDDNGSAAERSLESFGRSLKAAQTLDRNYTLLHKLQAMKNLSETDPSKGAVNTSCLPNKNGNTVRTKKRKTIKSELAPWHVEVTRGSDRLEDFSVAEQDWGCAINHLVEKIEDDTELSGEGKQMHHRSKKRLILTTRLMQQLLRPAPTPILRGDANSQCDSLVYVASKLALGDACSLTNSSRNELRATSDDRDTTSVKNDNKHLVNVMEGFAERAKILEKDFSRLESSSILDITLDYQDLERNSVINRFAKFHMRGQTIPSGPSNSGNPTTALKPAPQRYVNAFPMPTDLPEPTQCFSL